MTRRSEATELERFSFGERVAHWMAALSYLYAALTGLALWAPQLYWLSTLAGGGVAARRWHPWAGVLFSLVLARMFQSWARDMKLDADDRTWLRQSHRYAAHDDDGLPAPGRFNGGQKALFWAQMMLTLLLFASGVVLWFPELSIPRPLRYAALLAHPIAAAASVASILVHVYMGTVAIPGALRGMLHGTVPRRWARLHHPKWLRESDRS